MLINFKLECFLFPALMLIRVSVDEKKLKIQTSHLDVSCRRDLYLLVAYKFKPKIGWPRHEMMPFLVHHQRTNKPTSQGELDELSQCSSSSSFSRPYCDTLRVLNEPLDLFPISIYIYILFPLKVPPFQIKLTVHKTNPNVRNRRKCIEISVAFISTIL